MSELAGAGGMMAGRDESPWSDYAATKSRAALERVIVLYIDVVYRAALREVQDVQMAEDVTQAVFIILAQRTPKISSESALAGWLFQTTRYCAANAIKIERRRRYHEHAAASQRSEVIVPALSANEAEQTSILHRLDDAIARLARADREAIVLRYLQGREMREVGHVFGISETAARKRVGRAVERLRDVFKKEGVAVATEGLGSALLLASAGTAPASLAGTVSSAIGTAASPAVGLIAQGATRMLVLAQIKIVATVALAILILIGSALLLALHSSNGSAAAAPTTSPTTGAAVATEKTFTLTITDKLTGKPLPDTSMQVFIDNDRTTESTDGSGKLQISLGKKGSASLLLRVAKPGYSPVRLQWSSVNSPDPAPSDYTLHLEKGTSVGGVVQDKNGQPIAGVGVFIIMTKASPDPHETADIFDVQVKTGSDGRWRYELAPEKPATISVRLSHPGYVSDDMYGDTDRDETPADFRNLDHLLVMHKGFAVLGRVMDESGKPIVGAHVKQGDDRWGSDYPQTKTNALGEFKFAQAKSGKMTLTVEANGHAPELKEITVGDDDGLVEIKLHASKAIHGIVVDPKNQPVEGAVVVADTWRKKRTLEWQTKTDFDGRFEWDNAPSDAVTFHVLKREYMANRSAVLIASEEDQTIALRPPLQIDGTVTDAKTGQPVPKFRFIYGRQYVEGDQTYWYRPGSRGSADGNYTIKLQEPFGLAMIRIEADGYAPAVSRGFKLTEGMDAPLRFDFKLEEVQGIRTVVLSPDGTPAAGAQLALAMPRLGRRVTGGQFDRDAAIITAGKDGAIVLTPQDDPAVIVVLSDAGYATLPFAALTAMPTKTIQLQAWATIDATFKVGSRPFAGEPVHASAGGRPLVPDIYVSFESASGTDSNGRAQFEKMPAGPGRVEDWRMQPNLIWGGVVRSDYEAVAGQTLHIQAGGIGRPVIGRVVIPAEDKGLVDTLSGAEGHLSFRGRQSDSDKVIPIPYPPNWSTMSFDARREWWQRPELLSIHNDVVAKWNRALQTISYSAIFEPDGRFRINDVPTGTYDLNLNVGPPVGQRTVNAVRLMASKSVTMPPVPGGQSDEPLDLGAIALSPKPASVPVTPPAVAIVSPTTAPAPDSPADGDRAIPSGPGAAYTAQSMVRINGEWKLNIGEMFVTMPLDSTEREKSLDGILKSLATLTTALKSGKVKTAAEAEPYFAVR